MKELLNQQAACSYNNGMPGAGQGKTMSKSHDQGPPPAAAGAGSMMPHSMQAGIDPFLGQTIAGNDLHVRQNSGDSGLGRVYSFRGRVPFSIRKVISALDWFFG